jgi:hypothetical protein
VIGDLGRLSIPVGRKCGFEAAFECAWIDITFLSLKLAICTKTKGLVFRGLGHLSSQLRMKS